MKIFVTGGAGFIGKHLIKSLLKNHEILVYDNLSNSSKSGMFDLIKNGVKFVHGDILDYDLLKKSSKNYDTIIHLAAKIDVDESIRFPRQINDVNVTGTINTLSACVENNIQNFIASSSAAVFGNPTELPLTEKSLTYPISPYGASKLSMENYLQAFSQSYDMNCVSLRFFNIYGPCQSNVYAGVITKFIQMLVKDKPITIFGDGLNTRDFVAVDDIVTCIEKTINKIHGKKGNCYNIGSGNHITINELAKLLISISGKNIPIIHEDIKKGDITHSQTSISLAQSELEYSPKIPLKNGLTHLYEYFTKNI